MVRSRKEEVPVIASRILERLTIAQIREGVMGDFNEHYFWIVSQKGRFIAWIWYWLQIVQIAPACIADSTLLGVTMGLNYLRTALRQFKKHPVFSAMNLLGLAVGMSVCILAAIWIQSNLDTNRFHEKIDRIHLVMTKQLLGDDTRTISGTVPALGPGLKAAYPEILDAVRMYDNPLQMLLTHGQKTFKDRVQFADASLFDLFTFPLISGQRDQIRNGDQVMVLSRSMGKKLFGEDDPVGRVVMLENAYAFTVAGVMEDIPGNSTIDFDIWVPLEFLRKLNGEHFIDTWTNMAFRTYVELMPGVVKEEVDEKIKTHIPRADGDTVLEPRLFPFRNYYLDFYGIKPRMWMYGLISLFILLIACINTINLSTARAVKRSREVGLRKVVGAGRHQLVHQFMSESLLISLFAMGLSLVLVFWTAPLFSRLAGMRVQPDLRIHLPVLIGIGLLTGILSGAYPSLVLASFSPVEVFRKRLRQSSGRGLRRSLVISQFTLSVILIIGTAVIFSQSRYMKTKDVGYDRDSLIYLPLDGSLAASCDALKQELVNHPCIVHATLTSHVPDGVIWSDTGWLWKGKPLRSSPRITLMNVDPDFIETFGIEMNQGEFFRAYSNAGGFKAVINQSMADLMGASHVPGQQIWKNEVSVSILGVVRDFHYRSVEYDIGPMMIFSDPNIRSYRYLFLRLKPGSADGALRFIRSRVREMVPDAPLEIHFLNSELRRMYGRIDRFNVLVECFALLAIVISCGGLFGLASYLCEQRTKEIGVRKVLGSSASEIFLLLSREYILEIVLANMIAWPIAYYLMTLWLSGFAHRVDLGIDVFLLSGALTFCIALLTVSWQSVRASRTNPVNALRYE